MKTLQFPVYTLAQFKEYIKPSVIRHLEKVLRDRTIDCFLFDGSETLSIDNFKNFVERHFIDYDFPKTPFFLETGELNAYYFVAAGGCQCFIHVGKE